MELLFFLSVIVIGFFLLKSLNKLFFVKDKYCTVCGSIGQPVRHMPGSIIIEIALWCSFIIPGIIYTLWRHSVEHRVCHKCKSKNIVPLDTPAAKNGLSNRN